MVDGKTLRLADEVRYIQRRAADHDGRIVTIGQLVLFSTDTGDAWLLDPSARINELLGGSTRPLWPLRASQPLLAVERLVANYMRWGFERRIAEMAAWRRAIELSLTVTDAAKLRSIAQSRTEPASRVERARILLAYREDPSFFAVGQALGLHHQTVQRCVERAVAEGPLAALDDRPRPGREPTITIEAKAWLVDLACRTRRRTSAIRTNCGRRGFSPGTPASMGARKGMRASPTWRRARYAKSSTKKT